jgi:hypothetical protein
MATAAFQIPACNLRSDATNPISINDVADTHVGKWVAAYANAAQADGHFCFYMPGNYFTGNVAAKVRWRAKAGTVTQTKAFNLKAANRYQRLRRSRFHQRSDDEHGFSLECR